MDTGIEVCLNILRLPLKTTNTTTAQKQNRLACSWRLRSMSGGLTIPDLDGRRPSGAVYASAHPTSYNDNSPMAWLCSKTGRNGYAPIGRGLEATIPALDERRPFGAVYASAHLTSEANESAFHKRIIDKTTSS
jgi:hypothetical protein